MKFTLEEYTRLHVKAKTALDAFNALNDAMSDVLLNHLKLGHGNEGLVIRNLEDGLSFVPAFLRSMLMQDQWQGGDSSLKDNSAVREPDFVTSPHPIPGTRGKEVHDLLP